MKGFRLIRLTMILATVAVLTACQGADVKPIIEQLNSNIAKNCDVHLAGSIGGGAVGVPASTVTFQMDCKPHPDTVPAAAGQPPAATPSPAPGAPPGVGL